MSSCSTTDLLVVVSNGIARVFNMTAAIEVVAFEIPKGWQGFFTHFTKSSLT